MKLFLGLLVAALAVTGCDESSGGGGSGAKAEATPIIVGSKESGGDFKADCFDCAVDGPGAFIETGVSQNHAFWKRGDTWQVAYQLHSDARTQMMPMQLLQQTKNDVGVAVLTYEVIELGEHTIGGQVRQTATIKIVQGELRGQASQVVPTQELVKIDTYTRRIDLVINDLWQPVSVREYTKAYPQGRTTKQDPRKALLNLDSAFPMVVPNAYTGAGTADLPALDGALKDLLEAVVPNHATQSYLHFDLKGQGYGLSEQVYWAKDTPWPFLVETPVATGILISHSW